jgi:tetratricopeptide (TPR) repeat protein
MTEAPVIARSEIAQQVARTSGDRVSSEAVRAQLDSVLSSKAFARSPRISRFLTFVVEQTLAGQESKLKEYLLGVEVFGRLDSFDPRIDSIVRVEARRLRYKLEKYYEQEGLADPIHIQFRKGCYVPAFSEKRVGEDGRNGELSDVPYVRAILNPQVFAQYARGLHALGRWAADGVSEAVACFTSALEEDPDCSGAHAGLANAWMLASLIGLMPARDVAPKAKNSALRALAVAPNTSEAHSILGIVAALYDYEWADAEPKLRKAIHTNPCDTSARLWYALYLTLAGRSEDAIREARRVQQAIPASATAHLTVGFACHAAGAYEEASGQYRLAQDLEPGFYAPYLAMGLLATDRGAFEQAAESLNRAAKLQPDSPSVSAAMVYSHAAAQREDAARKTLAELSDLALRRYVSPLAHAAAYSATGDIDAAYRKLEEAMEERSTWLPIIRFSPVFEGVRQDPRFESLWARLRVPQLLQPA